MTPLAWIIRPIRDLVASDVILASCQPAQSLSLSIVAYLVTTAVYLEIACKCNASDQEEQRVQAICGEHEKGRDGESLADGAGDEVEQ